MFSRLSEVIAPASTAQSSETPEPTSSNRSNSSSHKNTLRLSSSLQDFSAYRQLVPDQPDPHFESGRYAKQSHALLRDHYGSSFSKEKPPYPSTRNKCFRIFILLLTLILFAFLVYMISMYIYSNWYRGPSKFYVILDCGSTGTRIFVYHASLNPQKNGALPIFLKPVTEGLSRKTSSQSGRAYDRMETEPGFDKLVHNVSGLKAAIKPLLKWAEKQIPEHAHKSTSIFIYATAGVRRLPTADSKWLLDNVWSILKKSSPFLCRREWVKIISGTEEAYFGWTALNYHTGMLGAIPDKATFGALDLGGSSLQVTFESEKLKRNQSNLNLRIGSVNHHLSAYSLSGYGLNDAFDKSVAKLLSKLGHINKADLVNGKVEIKHPCLQSGYKEQYICSRCASGPQEGASPVIGDKQSGKGAKTGIAVVLTGSPNWQECSALAKSAVNLSEWSNVSPGMDCDLQPCALADGLPRPSGQFYAMSGFYVVYRFFNLTSEAALDDVLEKGREFCEKQWEVARKSVQPQPFIEQYCFRSPYIVLLLREGLHITDKQVMVGSGSITWTLGVALLQAGKTFSTRVGIDSYKILQMKINPFILIAVFMVSLIFLVCALSCVNNWMSRFFRRSYLPLFRHNSASTASVLNIPSPFRFQRWSPINSGMSVHMVC